jgi:uncharacterized protein YoxC
LSNFAAAQAVRRHQLLQAGRVPAPRPSAPSNLGVRQSPLTVMNQRQQRAARDEERSQPSGNPILDAQRAGQASGEYSTSGGGLRSRIGGLKDRGLGLVLNNPVTDNVLNSLQTLDYGRRAVLGGINELAMAADGEGFSGARWMRNVNNPSFGFGQMFPDTGNKWVDRGIGFVGDVLGDPITYTGLGVPAKLIGASGRGVAAHAVRHLGEESVQRVGRLGPLGTRSGSPERAVMAAQGYADPGIRIGGAKIPGTTTFADVTGEALTRSRARLMQGRVGTGVRAIRHPLHRDLRGSYEKLATGRGAMTATEAAANIAAANQERIAKGMFRAAYAKKVADATNHMSPRQRRQLQRDVHAGVINTETDKVRNLFAEVRTELQKQGIDVGDLGPNYVPRVWTDKGRSWLMGDSPAAVDARRVFRISDDAASGVTLSRRITTGTYDLNGVPITLRTGSPDEINEVLGKAVPGIGKFVEDDMGRILAKYMNSAQSDIGTAAYGRHMQKLGHAWQADDPSVLVSQIDKAGTKQAAKEAIKNAEREVTRLEREVADLAKSTERHMSKAQKAVVKDVEGKLAAARREVDRAQKALDRALARFGPDSRAVRDATADVDRVIAKTEKVLAPLERRVADARRPATIKKRSGELGEAAVSRTVLEWEAGGHLNRLLEKQAQNRQGAMGQLDRVGRAKESVRVLRKELSAAKGINTAARKEFDQEINDLAKMVAAIGDDDAMLKAAESLAEAIAGNLKIEKAGVSLASQRSLIRAGKAGELTPVMEQVLSDQFARFADELLVGPNALVMRREVAAMGARVQEALSTHAIWRFWDEQIAFFKAYATATPGFHVRNQMSATFMNISDGVSVAMHLKAFRMWKALKEDSEKFLREADAATLEALPAVFGSGAGGPFSSAALDLDMIKHRPMQALTNTPWTKLSRWAGEYVEGPVRLAMALDTVAKGGSTEFALQRITRIHFDYSHLSNFDRQMRRLIPFWTYMSRNLPMQVQQMWLNPRLYAHYNSLVRNFRTDGNGEYVQLWWEEKGAWRVGEHNGVSQYLMPDFQHVDLKRELETFTNPRMFLSSSVPMLSVPAELIGDRKFFSGNSFRDDENKLLYALQQLLPPMNTSQRLFGGGDYGDERRVQSWANFWGVPLRQLTPTQERSEKRRREREQEEARKR